MRISRTQACNISPEPLSPVHAFQQGANTDTMIQALGTDVPDWNLGSMDVS